MIIYWCFLTWACGSSLNLASHVLYCVWPFVVSFPLTLWHPRSALHAGLNPTDPDREDVPASQIGTCFITDRFSLRFPYVQCRPGAILRAREWEGDEVASRVVGTFVGARCQNPTVAHSPTNVLLTDKTSVTVWRRGWMRQETHMLHHMDGQGSRGWRGCWPGNNRHPAQDFMCGEEAAAAREAF